MKELTSTSFGYAIAYLLPGIFGLYALSYWYPPAGVLLRPMFKADTSVGPSAVLLLIAVGIGLCLSAGRYFIFQAGRTGCKPPLELSQDPEMLAWQNGWLRGHAALNSKLLHVSLCFVGFELLLERSASDALSQYVKKCQAAAARIQEKKAAAVGGSR